MLIAEKLKRENPDSWEIVKFQNMRMAKADDSLCYPSFILNIPFVRKLKLRKPKTIYDPLVYD